MALALLGTECVKAGVKLSANSLATLSRLAVLESSQAYGQSQYNSLMLEFLQQELQMVKDDINAATFEASDCHTVDIERSLKTMLRKIELIEKTLDNIKESWEISKLIRSDKYEGQFKSILAELISFQNKVDAHNQEMQAITSRLWAQPEHFTPDKVTNLQCKEANGQILISWDDPNPSEVITSYEVACNYSLNGKYPVGIKRIDASKRSYVIKTPFIKPWTVYDFKVRACNNETYGDWSVVEMVGVKGRPQRPEAIKPKVMTCSSIKLDFEGFPEGQDITHTVIKVLRRNTKKNDILEQELKFLISTEVKISNLQAHAQYRIMAQYKGDSGLSDTTEVMCQLPTPHPRMGQVIARGYSKSVVLSWDISECTCSRKYRIERSCVNCTSPTSLETVDESKLERRRGLLMWRDTSEVIKKRAVTSYTYTVTRLTTSPPNETPQKVRVTVYLGTNWFWIPNWWNGCQCKKKVD